MIAAALALRVLLSAAVPSPQPVESSVDTPTPSYALPALEAAGMHFGFLAFNNLVTQEPFALVSWDTMESHVDGRSGWTFDVDRFVTNQFGHPYQGSMPFTAARSAGVSFWVASLYAFASSLAWELFFERDAPSINDQITTTLGGVLLGEALFRSYHALIDGDAPPSLLQRLEGALLSPVSAVNDWLMDGAPAQASVPHAPALRLEARPGVALISRLFQVTNGERHLLRVDGAQGYLGVELEYGDPTLPTFRSSAPFSYFDVDAAVTAYGVRTTNLYIRGLLAGAHFGSSEDRLRGVAGMFGLYDFGANHIARISSVGAGGGTVFGLWLTERTRLDVTAIGGLVGFGAAGSLGLDRTALRDYHIGPGVQALLQARLALGSVGRVGLTLRHWAIRGYFTGQPQGYEMVDHVTADLRVHLVGRLSAGIDAPVFSRAFQFDGEPAESYLGGGPRLVLVLSDQSPRGTP